jgi:hypothetical protein
LATAFFKAFRAGAAGADLPRVGVDGFDFAATFFDLARALAMTCNDPGLEGGDWRIFARLTPFWASLRKPGSDV